METLDREKIESALASLMVECSLIDRDDPVAVLALAERSEAALSEWSLSNPDFSIPRDRCRLVVAGLKAGKPCAPGLERLSQALTLACEQILPAGDPHPSLAEPLKPRDVEQISPLAGEPQTLEVDDDLASGLTDFMQEAPELAQSVEEGLLKALQGQAVDALSLYRPVHTLKGIFGFMNMGAMNRLFHRAESLLEPYKRNGGQPDKGQSERLLAVIDAAHRQIEAVRQGLPKRSVELINVAPVEALLSGSAQANDSTRAIPGEADAHEKGAEASTLRISTQKMDFLLETVGELAICQAQVEEGLRHVEVEERVSRELGRMGKISRQLQEATLSLRMVPVQPLFNRLARHVYELARQMGKPVSVTLEGGETEIDKSLVEDLVEPMVHLIRNAVDHGLEDPQARAAAGKNPEGQLRISAGHQGGDFALELEDDGRGVNLEKVKSKALALGWVEPGASLSDAEWLALLFRPGFSTAETVTEVSGRGVGLDAVRRKVDELGGSVRLESRPGQGARFLVRLPLSVALVDAILVRAGQDSLVLPAARVLRFLAFDPATRHAFGRGQAWVEAAGKSLPVVDLGSRGAERAVALHVEANGLEACLVVDEVLGKRQVVVKSLGGLLGKLPGLAGGAILPDGHVGLILDLDSLLRQSAHGLSSEQGGSHE